MKSIHSLSYSTFIFTLTTLSNPGYGSLNYNEQSWKFLVYLDNSPIGYHNFTLQQNNNEWVLSTKAAFDVKIMFFTFYKYRHENTEIWNGNCLKQLSSNTNDNGDTSFVRLHQQGNAISIETQNASSIVHHCVRSFAYWNPQLLKNDQLLNSQTGELVNVELNYLGHDSLIVNNKPVTSNRYRLHGKKIEIDLWYSLDHQWLALQSTTDNGSILRYELKPEMEQ